MQVKRDYYQNVEAPDFLLCKANRERIGIIPCTTKTVDLNFGDLDEINFTTYYMTDGELNPVYPYIDVMKYILVPDIGFFFINSCDTHSEGSEHEYKEVVARSYEGLLGQKYLETFMINTGETGSKELEYDESGKTQIYIYLDATQKTSGRMDLFDYVLEKCPDWYVDYVDPVLLEDDRSHRSFNIDRKDVYSFIMNDMQEAFECYVEFDTLKLDNKGRCAIRVYAQENYKYVTDIYVSYDNLLKNTDISSDTDDIKTCVVLQGKDDFEIREINFGYDRLYNFDYYNNTDFWSQRLYDEYNTWHNKVYNVGMIERSSRVYTEDLTNEELAKMSYIDLYKLRLNAYLQSKSDLYDLENLTSSFVNDADRKVGWGEFPVFNDNNEEVGSIKFDCYTVACVGNSLPSNPTENEKNAVYFLKSTTNISEINTYTANVNKLNPGFGYNIIKNPPYSYMHIMDVYTLQTEFINPDTDDSTEKNRLKLRKRLHELEEGGKVNLVFRPIIDTSELEKAGWGEQEPGIATLFSSTYSNETETIAMNFTPIVAYEDPNVKGRIRYKRILSPSELQSYAEHIIWQYENNDDHSYKDKYNIKIGQTFISDENGSAIDKAVDAAIEMHNIHETLYEYDGYWKYFDADNPINDGKDVKLRNYNMTHSIIDSEKGKIKNYLENYNRKKRYNEQQKREVYKLDDQIYNDTLKRQDILNLSTTGRIYDAHPEPTYVISSAIAQGIISYSSVYNEMLTPYNNAYEITDIDRYLHQLTVDLNSQKNLLETAKANAVVTYPDNGVYRWFDNTNTRTFYNALSHCNSVYKDTGSVPIADAKVMVNEEYGNPLYYTCLQIIDATNSVVITDKEAFEEYLEEDLTEQTALITKFPNSTWFNTNDWRGYGYSELRDTWALSMEQAMAVINKNNWGILDATYREKEKIDPLIQLEEQTSSDEEDPYNYFGHYLPTYLNQLAIEKRIAELDQQIQGYDTYPYPLTSKGSCYYERLPGNPSRGDTYSISNNFTLDGVWYPAGTNVTWNGSKWVTTASITVHVNGLQDLIDNNAKYKEQVVQEIALDNNLSEASRIELSAFIREEELSNDNYLLTDTMTEEERQEMLQSFLDYGEKELRKISAPQLKFTATMANLFAIPEFDTVSDDFEPGKTIFVSVRDDYHIKASLLTIHMNFYDPTDFTMTFSDVLKKSEGLYTDIQDALNTATDAATSVAIGSSTWSSGAARVTRITTTLEEGLLSQGAYLRDNPAQCTFEITDTGIFIDTASGDYGKFDAFGNQKFIYDSIYMGGGRILFTDDGWKHVRMSLGRSKVKKITSTGGITNDEEFGVFADFCIAGYVGGSQICGGELFSSAFCNNNRDPITYFDLDNGTFVLRDKNANKVLEFNQDGLTIGGYATSAELDAEAQARSEADSAEAQTRYNETTANARAISKEIQDRIDSISAENSARTESEAAIIKEVGDKYAYIEANYSTRQALATWLAGSYTTTYTKINGGHITTGFISAGSGVSWIDLDNGWFNFGGGVKDQPGQTTQNPNNYLAWVGGELVVKGNIYANNGTFMGEVKASSGNIGGLKINTNSNQSLDSSDGLVHLGPDGIRVGTPYWYPDQQGDGSGFALEVTNGRLYVGAITTRGIATKSIYAYPQTNTTGFSISSEDLNGVSLYLGNHCIRPDFSVNGGNTFQINITGKANYAGTADTAGTATTCTEAYYIIGNAGSCYVGTYGFNPNSDGGINCGGSEHRWKQVYATNGTINTSDRNEKHNIREIDDVYEQLFFKLQPVNYMRNNGDRTHIGFIAQDIEKALTDLDLTTMDLSALCMDEKTTIALDENNEEVKEPLLDENGNKSYRYGIRYTEFISLNTHMIQKLYKRVEELENEIERIKNA